MPYIISAILVIAITAMGAFWLYVDRSHKKRYNAEVARIKALPLHERLNELLNARGEQAKARLHLAATRRAFKSSWGFRRNPYFTRLLLAESSYSGARAWVKTLETLCDERSNAA